MRTRSSSPKGSTRGWCRCPPGDIFEDIFDHQSKEYGNTVLSPQVTSRVAIEQASAFGWERYIGQTGRMIGMTKFGASAPLKELQRKFAFEPERLVAVAKELLGKS